MSKQASGRRPNKSRIVKYWFVGPFTFGGSDWIEKRLTKAKRDGIITEWDDGRGDIPWFEGPPGPKLRALRDEFFAAGGTVFGKPYTDPDQKPGF